MTIIKPNKKKKTLIPLFIMFSVMLAGGLVYINEYESQAEKKYQLQTLKEDISEAEVVNAELKNDFYKITDPSNLESLAGELNLSVDSDPSYLNINQWVSDSSY